MIYLFEFVYPFIPETSCTLAYVLAKIAKSILKNFLIILHTSNTKFPFANVNSLWIKIIFKPILNGFFEIIWYNTSYLLDIWIDFLYFPWGAPSIYWRIFTWFQIFWFENCLTLMAHFKFLEFLYYFFGILLLFFTFPEHIIFLDFKFTRISIV